MLEKKRKGNHVSKLRTICLLEADFNFNNKKLGRDILRCAEHNNLLPREQYGSRKCKRAILHVVNKRLLYDSIHLQRRPAILCSNDAKSNYDRIAHSIASMACQRLGMPTQPLICMFQTIQDLQHHIRTAYGTSTSFMTNTLTKPSQGTCQGNGASPAIWVAVSAPLLDMMRSANHGIKILTPITNEKDHIVGFAFVDDTDIIEGDLNNNTTSYQSVALFMQEGIDRWEGGFKATGGAIRPDKSFIFPIAFKWDDNGDYTFSSLNDLQPTFTVKDEHNNRKPLPLKEPHKGAETLGVYMCPDGNNKAQLDYMTSKVTE